MQFENVQPQDVAKLLPDFCQFQPCVAYKKRCVISCRLTGKKTFQSQRNKFKTRHIKRCDNEDSYLLQVGYEDAKPKYLCFIETINLL